MKIKSKRWQMIVGYGTLILFAGLVAWLLIKIWLLFWDFISRANPTVGAAIIAATGTVLISVFTLVWNRRSERQKEIAQRRWEIEQEIRKQKLPIYEELLAFLFEVINTAKSSKPLTVDEMSKRLVYFTQKTVVWGGDSFLQAFSTFRDGAMLQAQATGNQQANPLAMMVNFENLLYAIRADYGHTNKGLRQGDLLALFINDIRDYIPKQK